MALTLSKPAVEVIMHALQNCPGLTWAQSNVAIMELHQQIAQMQQAARARVAADVAEPKPAAKKK